MKTNKSFTSLWTPWRVSKILREFKSSQCSSYLCHRSETFSKLWTNHHEKIRSLARAHFPEETSDSDSEPNLATLFGYCPQGNDLTRLQFLQLELKRLKSLKNK